MFINIINVKLTKFKLLQFKNKILNPPHWSYKPLTPIYKLVRFAYYFCFSSSYRHDRFNQVRYHSDCIQPNSFTVYNRYPDLFANCKQIFASLPHPKVMSFGCSTGAEVFTLLYYLPTANIIGSDINQHNLKVARRKNLNPNQIKFIHSKSLLFDQENDFDCIFCLAVLQHTKNRELNNTIARAFRFERFVDILTQLDAKLKVGGVLFIDHCDFNFEHTPLAQRYEVLAVNNNLIVRDRPVYDQNNYIMSETSELFRIFVKRSLS